MIAAIFFASMPLVATQVPLGDGPADYLAYDREHHRVWAPGGAGVTLISDDGQVVRIDGFPTTERVIRGQKRTVGPSSVAIGGGFAFIGNRADATICAIDTRTLARKGCVTIPSPPDGLAYVGEQVWATTPSSHSLTIIDHLAIAATVPLDGEPEGYALDGAGHFFTNLEDRDRTLVIDIATRSVVKSLHPHCGDAGPRGLVAVGARVVVACTDHLVVIDIASDRVLSTLATGDGVDNIDYFAPTRSVYAVAGKDARLTIATLDEAGRLTLSGSAPTHPGTRVVVSDAQGNAYVGDARASAMWIFAPDWNALAAEMTAGDATAILQREAPALSAAIAEAARHPDLHALWGTCSNVDELAHGVVVAPAIVDALNVIAHAAPREGEHTHAGIQHTFGYFFSTLKTAYGYKRERWVKPDIEDGFGLPRGTLGVAPNAGTLFDNATYFAARFALADDAAAQKTLDANRAFVAPTLVDFDYASERTRIVETVRVDGRAVELRTDFVHFRQAQGGNVAWLIYSVREVGHARLITAFPVGQAFIDSKTRDQNPLVTAQYNAYIPGLTPRAGTRVVTNVRRGNSAGRSPDTH